MIKKRCITELFNGVNIKNEIENFINDNFNNHNVVQVIETPYNNSILVTIIYEVDLENDDKYLLKEIIKLAKDCDNLSMNFVQKELSIGFNRTSNCFRILEELKILSEKPRKLMINYEDAIKIIDEKC